MAELRKRCTKCRRQFRPQKGATHRKLCYTCSPPRSVPGDVEADAPLVPVLAGPIESRVLAELTEAGRECTVEGLLVLALARDIDAGRVTPAQKGAAGQRLLAVKAVALEGAASAIVDRVDELTARREQREREAS